MVEFKTALVSMFVLLAMCFGGLSVSEVTTYHVRSHDFGMMSSQVSRAHILNKATEYIRQMQRGGSMREVCIVVRNFTSLHIIRIRSSVTSVPYIFTW